MNNVNRINDNNKKNRLEYIDALRAFALFGVIMVHINQMYSFYNDCNDFSYFTSFGVKCKQIVYWLFDDKSRTIFSTLFGISCYFILRNPNYSNGKFAWRCLLLIVFGLFDKLFSSGDILMWYGINGIIISFIPVKRIRPSILLTIAILLFFISFINISPFFNTSLPNRYLTNTNLIDIITYPMSDIVVSDLSGRLCIDSTMTLSCFFVGFYLGKSGIIENINRYTSIRVCILTTFLFAATLILYRISYYDLTLWRFSVLTGAFALSIDFIYLFNHSAKILTPLTRYGKLGLTNYSSQYIIGTILILYVAIPLRISIEFVFMYGIALYLLQLVFAQIWTSHFRYGPLEWLWRTATNKCPTCFMKNTKRRNESR